MIKCLRQWRRAGKIKYTALDLIIVIAVTAATPVAKSAPLNSDLVWRSAYFNFISDPIIVAHDLYLAGATASNDRALCQQKLHEISIHLMPTIKGNTYNKAAEAYCRELGGRNLVADLKVAHATILIATQGCAILQQDILQLCQALLAVLSAWDDNVKQQLKERHTQWAAEVVPRVARLSFAFSASVQEMLGVSLSKKPLPVYLVSVGGEQGAYSINNQGRFAIFFSTESQKTRGLAAIEFIIHEALHDPDIERQIRGKYEIVHNTTCSRKWRALWHATIFAVSGDAAASSLKKVDMQHYEPYYRRTDVLIRLLGSRRKADEFLRSWTTYTRTLGSASNVDRHFARLIGLSCKTRSSKSDG